MDKQGLLYVAPFFEIPPTTGAAARAVHLLEQLTSEFHITLLIYRPHNVGSLQRWCSHREIRLRFIKQQATYGQKLSFFQRLFAERPPGFATHDPIGMSQDIDRLWEADGPFDAIFYATQLTAQCLLHRDRSTSHIVDLYDVYGNVVGAKHREISRLRPYHWLFRLEATRVRRYERKILSRASLLLTTSEPDRVLVDTLVKGVPIVMVPNGISIPPLGATPVASRKVLVVGSLHYAPNLEGFRWFYSRIWPLVRNCIPDAELIVVGSGEMAASEIIGSDPSVIITGKAPDLSSYYLAASCAVVPILSGGGTRLKLLEAMSWAVPAVSTSKGAEGIAHGNTVFIADDPDQFAKDIIRCIEHAVFARQKAIEAREIVTRHYSWTKIGEILRDALRQHVHAN